MAGPIYKLFMGKPTEAWYQLSEDERSTLSSKVSPENVGGKTIVLCTPVWSNEQWMFFGVEKFPDIEAVQQHAQDLNELNWFRYIESFSLLGTEWPST